ncbi:MAG: glycoside hydrolase family 5 protein [Anaerolineae bacterium]|nr:glycoside hydrolase family 5 protein [Anaerolineae bacterium]
MSQERPLLRALVVLLTFTAVAGGCTAPAGPLPTPSPSPPAAAVETPAELPHPYLLNERLGRGVNLGDALEAPEEGSWGVVLKAEYFQLIKDAGFHSVRIPIRWSAHAAQSPPYTIEPAFFARIDWAVEQALSRGLLAVINVHHYDGLARSPAAHRERFLALWQQIAERYQDQPDELLFEILNEPHEALTAPLWNELLKDALAIIRRTNPDRVVVVGVTNWGGVGGLSGLELPAEDRNLIVTVHYYEPFHFTHQGAEWTSGSDAWLGTKWLGTAAEQAAVRRDLDVAASWGERHGRPIYLGEFGAYSRGEMESRARWTAFVAREAEARGFSWAYWEFCSGFGVYDPVLRRWNEDLLQALIPK